MTEFKVGDKVRIKKDCSGCRAGKIYPLHKTHKNGGIADNGLVAWDETVGKDACGCSCECNWKLVERNNMSKYQELKERIEGLNNGWTKEADDIIREVSKDKTILIIDNRQYDSNSMIQIFERNPISFEWNDKKALQVFRFKNSSQCEKMSAFKKALMWLLDHSDIKKDLVGTKQKAEIEGKIYKVKIIEEV